MGSCFSIRQDVEQAVEALRLLFDAAVPSSLIQPLSTAALDIDIKR